MLAFACILTLLSASPNGIALDSFPVPTQEFWFWNQTDLPRNAATRNTTETVYLNDFKLHHEAGIPAGNLFNQPVSGTFAPFSDESKFYTTPFALEFLILSHVNQPVGFQIGLHQADQSSVQAGVYGREIGFAVSQGQNLQRETRPLRPWKSYWSHFILSYTGSDIELFHQGEEISSLNASGFGPETRAFVKGFLANEPYMQLHDLIKQTASYATSFTAAQASSRFSYLQSHIQAGRLYPDRFQLLVGPYLNHITTNTAQLVWEADQPARGVVSYGEKVSLDQIVVIKENATPIQEVQIGNLKPGTTYYYQLSLKNEHGEAYQTPVLSFQTVKQHPSAFMFGIISDTESRPQINNQVAQRMWEERPDFLIHLGDLTDGGSRENKFQWTMEYFQGIGPLYARIPVATVPGNGDDDLHWYSRYHPHAGVKAYYRFDYGEASFWMLNSNLKEELRAGGAQYDWLASELEASKVRWKFVVLHHAPYSSDEDDYGNTWVGPGTFGDTELTDLIGLLEAQAVDMVFYGHLHTYMRTHPISRGEISPRGGIVYMQVGGAGGNLEDNAPTRTWFAAKNYRGHHYSTAQLVGDELEIRTYDLAGSLIDSYSLKK